jgi:RNA polymerase sigma-70 factor (ECF subfamily)
LTEDELTRAYATYGHLVLRRCRRLLHDPAAAEDATQDVFLKLWRYGDAFGAVDSKVAWLYRVADRCCLDRIGRDRGELPLASAPEPRADASQAASLEDGQIVIRYLERFDERLRQIAIYHYLDELSQGEIAEQTGWSRQTVNKKIGVLRDHADRLRDEIARTLQEV